MSADKDLPVRYYQHPALGVRPVPEAEICIVYCADEPRLYTLNLAAWAVFELCRGQTSSEITEAYIRLTVPPLTVQQAEGQVAMGLTQLREDRLIDARPTRAGTEGNRDGA
jgi:hypothetical protein